MISDRRDSPSVRSIFESLVELSASEQVQRLEAWDLDEATRGEVEKLLRLDDDGPGFLEELRVTNPPPPIDAQLDSLLIGRNVGGFEIIRHLGTGAMGRVYEARQNSPERAVALKTLASPFASVELLRRFEWESRVLARLRHPNIAQVYDAGVATVGDLSIAYFAMEFVPEALPITKFCEQQGLQVAARVRFVAAAAAAVHHGHLNEVVHRDLKPDNLLVGGDGVLRVIDFGVARVMDRNADVTTLHTRLGDLIGTLRYMSPEQCRGNPLLVDGRSDVYSLGVLLYELLAGELPYTVRTDSAIAAALSILESEPVPLHKRRPELRGDLSCVVHKALAKEPGDRYSSAAEFEEDLLAYLDDKPVSAAPQTVWSRCVSWVLRHPILASSSLALVFTIFATSIGVTLGVSWLQRVPQSSSEDGRRVFLLSGAGTSLHSWDSGVENGIEKHVEYLGPDGSRASVIAFDLASNLLPGQLAFYRWDAPTDPEWETRDPVAHPPRFEVEAGDHYHILDFLVADCVEDAPGDEVVVLQRLFPRSQTAVRVYGADGQILYEVWHDGALRKAHWDSTYRQLWVVGYDSELLWAERGVDGPGYPVVVMALRVENNYQNATSWLIEDSRIRDDHVLWYRWLGPVNTVAGMHFPRVSIEVETGVDESSPGIVCYVQREEGALPKWAQLFFTLDSLGSVVERRAGDEYRTDAARELAPPIEAFRWLDISELPRP